MLYRALRIHSGGRDRPAAEAVDAQLRFRAYISCIDFDCSARRASQKTRQKRSVAPARISVPTPTGRPTDEAKARCRPKAAPPSGCSSVRPKSRAPSCAAVRRMRPDWGTGAFSRRAAFERAVCRIRAKNRFRLIFTFSFSGAPDTGIRRVFRKKGAAPSRHLRTGALPALLYGCIAFLRRAARRTAGAFRRLGRRTPRAAAFHKRITISARE